MLFRSKGSEANSLSLLLVRGPSCSLFLQHLPYSEAGLESCGSILSAAGCVCVGVDPHLHAPQFKLKDVRAGGLSEHSRKQLGTGLHLERQMEGGRDLQ